MRADPVNTLEDILRRNGQDVDLRENEADRHFLFDQIADADDLDLAWAQFPAHREIRARAAQVDAVSDIVPGWGYRVPKGSNRCSDAELAGLVRGHIDAVRPLISDYTDVREFIERGFDIRVGGSELGGPPDPMQNALFLALYENLGDFQVNHYPLEESALEVLYDWAVYLTKCDEVAAYLLWPVLRDVESIDPDTPTSGFRLWQYGSRTNYWIKDGDPKSRLVCVLRPWSG